MAKCGRGWAEDGRMFGGIVVPAVKKNGRDDIFSCLVN